MPKQTKAQIARAQTRLVLASIEDSGTVPWRQPWTMTGFGANYNYSTGIAYRGVNVLMTAVSALEHGFSTPRGSPTRRLRHSTARCAWRARPAPQSPFGSRGRPRTKPPARTSSSTWCRGRSAIFNLDQIDGIEYETPDLGDHCRGHRRYRADQACLRRPADYRAPNAGQGLLHARYRQDHAAGARTVRQHRRLRRDPVPRTGALDRP